MMVAAIDDGNLRTLSPKRANSRQTSESRSDNDNPVCFLVFPHETPP
jgi:hypothetical protein